MKMGVPTRTDQIKDIQIREIKAEDTIDLRQLLLRPHLTLAECAYAQDGLPSSFHLGGFSDGRLVAIASFFAEAPPGTEARNPYRLRQMATRPEFRGLGIGRRLLEEGETRLQAREVDLLWCHARLVAFLFYEKMGFQYQGDFFDVPKIGPHKIMLKWLTVTER